MISYTIYQKDQAGFVKLGTIKGALTYSISDTGIITLYDQNKDEAAVFIGHADNVIVITSDFK